MKLTEADSELITISKKLAIPISRISIFIVYFWFGILKVLGLSPATPLVQKLFNVTLPFFDFPTFLTFFGLFEVTIGVMFLFKRLDRFAMPLLFSHLLTTIMPLFLIPEVWNGFLIPTMETQYIIKNVLIVAVAINIGSKIKD